MTSSSYRALCETAEAAQGTIKLGRGPQGWTLQVILRPNSDDPACRAAGAIFPDLSELDLQSSHLCEWIKNSRRDAATEEVR